MATVFAFFESTTLAVTRFDAMRAWVHTHEEVAEVEAPAAALECAARMLSFGRPQLDSREDAARGPHSPGASGGEERGCSCDH